LDIVSRSYDTKVRILAFPADIFPAVQADSQKINNLALIIN